MKFGHLADGGTVALAERPEPEAGPGEVVVALAVTLACAFGIAFFGYRLGRMLLANARPVRLLSTRAT